MAASASPEKQAEFARFVLTKHMQVKPGENVTIEGWSHTLPWAVALAREARRLKAYPIILHEDEDAFWDSVEAKEDALLGAAPKHEWAALGKTDVYIHMWGAGDRVRLASLAKGRAEKLTAWNPAWYMTAAKVGLRGARLDIGRPFPNLAKNYQVDLGEWENMLVDATMVDPDKMAAVGKPIIKALETGRKLRITDDNGTDLTLGLKGRKTSLATGRVRKEDMKNPFTQLSLIPTGVISVAIDEEVADGTIEANRSTYTETDMLTGGKFEFKDGRLVDYSFKSGLEFWEPDWKKGGKGRDQPGRLSIGLNPKLHNTPQLEDREAGAIVVTVGNNEFQDGGKNKSKFGGLVVNAGARIEIDGKALKLPG